MTDYQVTLEVFSGPLDLLLALVRRASLDVSTISLARVTHDYLEHLAHLEEIDPGALADFCEVAATLLLLKSQSLLPRPPAPPTDDEIESPAALAERLRAYRQYRDTAEHLAQRHERGLRAFVRTPVPAEMPPRLEPGELTVGQLTAAFEAALLAVEREPVKGRAAAVRPHRYRMTERLREIRGILLDRRRVTFQELLGGPHPDRELIIVSFLAVLELLRQAAIRAVQEELFGRIVIELRPEVAARWQQDGFGEASSP